MSLAANITDAERIAVTSWLVGKPVDAFRIPDPARPEGFCGASPSPRPDLLVGPKWNGWAAGLTNSRFQPAEMVGIRAEQIPELKLKWAVGFPGAVAAFSQPVVGGGRIFVGSMNGAVYSLDPPAAAHIGFTKRRLPG